MDYCAASLKHAPSRAAIALLGASFVAALFSPNANAQLYTLRVIPPIGGTANLGSAINVRGQVTGVSCLPHILCQIARNSGTPRNLHAFLYSNGAVQDLGTLGGDDNYSTASGINASGAVTGASNYAGHSLHAFVYSNGSIQDLGTLGGHNSYGTSINDSGQVTGDSHIGVGTAFHAFLYSNGSMQDLGTLGGTNSGGTGINAGGQVAGWAFLTGDGPHHAFLYTNGSMQDLGTLGGAVDVSEADAVNVSGQVTGFSFNSDAVQVPFIFSHGSMHSLGTIGGNSTGVSINARCQVVGYYFTAQGDDRAFLYSNGQMLDLNTLIPSADASTYTLTDARGINNQGQIVANGYRTAGSSFPRAYRAFLLTPTASP